jgi:hypothetical protein
MDFLNQRESVVSSEMSHKALIIIGTVSKVRQDRKNGIVIYINVTYLISTL